MYASKGLAVLDALKKTRQHYIKLYAGCSTLEAIFLSKWHDYA